MSTVISRTGRLPRARAGRRALRVLALCLSVGCWASAAAAQEAGGWDRDDYAIAARFAPIFYQGMVGTRFDFITNFDFDGDWVGDNNWDHAADPQFPQKAYVYYAVSETPTHYFIHYAAFHPRDYKGGELTGALLSQAIRRGAQASTRVRNMPIAQDVVLAHENDLEGCLVVAEKRGPKLEDAEIVIVETLAHNRYLKFQRDATLTAAVGSFRREGQQPLVYIEPKGHGMEAYDDQLNRPGSEDATTTGTAGSSAPAGAGFVQKVGTLVSGLNKARRVVNLEGAERLRVYRYTGTASDPEQGDGDVGYELVPTYETMWARTRKGANESFGETQDYGAREVRVAAAAADAVKSITLGALGSSFRGVQGAENKARPPWGWFDMSERNRPLGEWFFDPAGAVQRHFPSMKMSAAYLHQPFLGIIRGR